MKEKNLEPKTLFLVYFEKGHLYHVYNQGNNRSVIFFNRRNYFFFKKKLRTHILPFCDIVAWCLMPNHFHLMVHVNEVEVDESLVLAKTGCDSKSQPVLPASPTNSSKSQRLISLNKSIGIMLSSYTRAINKEKGWSGSLFRSKTKAICLTRNDELSESWINVNGITQINISNSYTQYPIVCYNYILNNPVKDGFVLKREDWEFSSFNEIVNIKNSILINVDRIKEYRLIINN